MDIDRVWGKGTCDRVRGTSPSSDFPRVPAKKTMSLRNIAKRILLRAASHAATEFKFLDFPAVGIEEKLSE